MKRSKKLLCLLITLLLALGLLPGAALGTGELGSGTCGANLTWVLTEDGTLTVSGTGDMTDWASTGDVPWCSLRNRITNVILGSGVTSIGNNAFYETSQLKHFTIPANVTKLGAYAFNSSGLEEITIPATVTDLGYRTFNECRSLTSAVLCEGITALPQGIFYRCTALADVSLPDSLRSIGYIAFYVCNSLNSITIPGNVVTIEEGAFLECCHITSYAVASGNTAYKAVDGVLFTKDGKTLIAYPTDRAGSYAVPAGTERIAIGAFSNARLLTAVTIPESVTEIGRVAFYCCHQLQRAAIPSGVTVLQEYLFRNCSKLRDVYVPAGVTEINQGCFIECWGLTDVFFAGSEAQWSSVSILSGNNPLRAATIHYNASGLPPIFITRQPSDCPYGRVGQTAFFSVAASGEGLSYQWYYRTSPSGSWKAVSAPSGKTATYSLTVQARHNGYQYRCKISDGAYTVYSDTVTLTVFITRHPEDVTVHAGETAVFSVETSVPAEGYQWYYSKPDEAWENSYPVSAASGKTANYSLTAQPRHNGYRYYCEIYDGTEWHESDEALLTVLSGPVVTRQPVDYVGALGSTASFTVEASGDGLTYQWWVKTRSGSSFTKSSIKTAAYSVELTEARNGNQLYCVVTDASGNSVRTDTVTMTVGAALSITRQPVDYTGPIGSTASFTVEASGDGLTYQWWVKTRGGSSFTKSSIKTAAYSVELTEARNGNQLYCVVSDAYGNSLRTNTVSMTAGAALSITAQPVGYVGAVNSMARITVAAEGDGLSYAWFVKNPGSSDFTESSIHAATYSARLTAANSGRLLYCVVTDSHGNSLQSDTVSMSIGTPLAITTQPASYVGAVNSTARFSIVAEGDGLTYNWYVKNPGADWTLSSIHSANYTAKLTASNSGRQLYCVVTDSHGNTVTTDTVSMRIG